MEAEKEEFESYSGSMPEEWLKDLWPLKQTGIKDFWKSPWLIVVFKRSYELEEKPDINIKTIM